MYDEEKANKAVKFIKLLRHTKGEFAQKPFNLIPFQEKIIREIFGTVTDEGVRQYRECFIFIPRKNRKNRTYSSNSTLCIIYGQRIWSRNL